MALTGFVRLENTFQSSFKEKKMKPTQQVTNIKAMQEHITKENKMIKLESSCLDAMSVNNDENTLDLRFNSGTTYRYYGVPANLGDELLEAESQGKFFHVNIRDKYTCEKLMSEEEIEKEVAELISEIVKTLADLDEEVDELNGLNEDAGNSSSQEWGIDDDICCSEGYIDDYSTGLISMREQLEKIFDNKGIDIADYLQREGKLSENDMDLWWNYS